MGIHKKWYYYYELAQGVPWKIAYEHLLAQVDGNPRPSLNGQEPPKEAKPVPVFDKRGAAAPAEQDKRQQHRPAADVTPPMPTEAMRKRFHALGADVYGDEWDDKRPELVKWISGKRVGGATVTSSNELYRAEMQSLIDGMEEKKAKVQ